jgi:hypothetical protein
VVARQDQSDDELSKAAREDAHHSHDRAMEITRIDRADDNSQFLRTV